MSIFAILWLVLAFTANTVVFAKGGVIRSGNDLPADFAEFTMEFTGPVFADGPDVTFTGTAEQIFAHILAVNPSYETDFPGELPDTNATQLESMMAQDQDHVICNVGGDGPAQDWAILHGISYIGKLKGNCGASPGPNVCGRISCSYDSGIWWCNDKPESVQYPCDKFASWAQVIASSCEDKWDGFIWGQAFSSNDSFNVICAGASC
ncbi:hypothetical protein F4780DRAFT_793781 [Xylariomycetidae sp. FL0641]|nr:hypothetical protein F4780DRAFT_793781 [Xylariomycetidae sp. FL0641]